MNNETTTNTPNANANVKEVTLQEGIVRGDQRITAVRVRKPRAGELRGLSLAELMNLNVDAITAVLPRVTDPILHKPDVALLEPADLMSLGVAVLGFLLPKEPEAPSP